ncbi:MAG: glycosyltransferase family 2 protein [Dehalococcoidia bacterium]
MTIVPAHNEEALIARTVRSLLSDAPTVEVVVVADNCNDATAERAKAAGATVLVRSDAARRGKSYALDYAIADVALRSSLPDAVVIVDADTTVASGFYAALAAGLAAGPDAVQAHYAAAPSGAPVARLRSLAFRLLHWSRPLGSARIGIPTTLKGNGMALRWRLVRDGYGAAGLAEDAGLSVWLARRGVAVGFVPGATVWGEMAGSYGSARTQDERWEAGRMSLSKAALGAAVGAARRRQFGLACAMLDLGSLPLTLVAFFAAIAAVAGVAGLVPLIAGLTPGVLLGAYVIVGLAAARTPVRDLGAFVEAPRFIWHKLRTFARLALRRGPAGWERTAR